MAINIEGPFVRQVEVSPQKKSTDKKTVDNHLEHV